QVLRQVPRPGQRSSFSFVFSRVLLGSGFPVRFGFRTDFQAAFLLRLPPVPVTPGQVLRRILPAPSLPGGAAVLFRGAGPPYLLLTDFHMLLSAAGFLLPVSIFYFSVPDPALILSEVDPALLLLLSVLTLSPALPAGT